MPHGAIELATSTFAANAVTHLTKSVEGAEATHASLTSAKKDARTSIQSKIPENHRAQITEINEISDISKLIQKNENNSK